MATHISGSPEETEALGTDLAKHAIEGTVFALVGPLGAGKTRFVKGLARGIGSTGSVTSPTFTLIHEYRDGRLPIYHFDFFRLEEIGAAERLGLDDYFFGDGVCVVEWADKFPDLLPRSARWVSFEIKGECAREIEVK